MFFAIPKGVFTLAKEDSIFTPGPAKRIKQPRKALPAPGTEGINVSAKEFQTELWRKIHTLKVARDMPRLSLATA